MIQRSLLRQAQRASTTAITATPLRSMFLQRPQYLSSRLPAPTRARILSRWYVDSAVKEKEEVVNAADATIEDGASAANGAVANEDPVRKELEAKTREVVDLKDKYLRQVAEYRNLQERTRREIQAAKDFAIQRFAKDLIESIDTFDLALSAVPASKLAPPPPSSSTASSTSASSDGSASSSDVLPEDAHKDLKQLHSGLKMTETVLMNTLKKHGLERFDPSVEGEKFDPNRHEAMFQTMQEGKVDGSVFHTTQKGFLLNGRVLRAAKVGVVKNS